MHLPREEIEPAVARMLEILKPGGVIYLSFRLTENADHREKDGRLFTAYVGDHVRRALGRTRDSVRCNGPASGRRHHPATHCARRLASCGGRFRRPFSGHGIRTHRILAQRRRWRASAQLLAQAQARGRADSLRRGIARGLLLRLRQGHAAAGESDACRARSPISCCRSTPFPTCCRCIGFTDDAAVLATTIKLVASNIRPAHREAARSAHGRALRPQDHLAHHFALGNRLERGRRFAQRIDRMHVRRQLALRAPRRELFVMLARWPCGSRSSRRPNRRRARRSCAAAPD